MMKKRWIGFVLFALMMIVCSCASASISEIKRFAPYTDVNLDVFIDAGYSCYYDDYRFSAEISPKINKIVSLTNEGKYSETKYTIRMDVKIIYSAGQCTLVPRLIFTRSGWDPYFDDRMSEVFIRNGENRYIVDVSGCSRSSSAKDNVATDSSVEPMYTVGVAMLQDLAEYPQTVSVKMGEYSSAFTLSSNDLTAIKEFYETCKQAGVFEQEILLNDDYSVRTLFNNTAIDVQEDAIEEPAEPEGEAA